MTERLSDAELDELENQLNDLAPRWRGAETEELSNQIAAEYAAVLIKMVNGGFNQSLDMDAELPERLMPKEYLDLFTKPPYKV